MSDQNPSDTIYSKPLGNIDRFAFDEKVARVFKDMINRSVPGYQTLLGMLGVFAAKYAQNGTKVYDLGCSLGGSTLMLRQHVSANTEIVGIDYSPEMVERCKANVAADSSPATTEIICADVRSIEFEPCSLVTMNFTLQFLPEEDRLPLLQRIYDALLPDGAFILCEKVIYPHSNEQEWHTELYHEFKKANGYSELEVAQKRSALENVLRPETVEAHKQRLSQVGFNEFHHWYQCFTFAGMMAVKK